MIQGIRLVKKTTLHLSDLIKSFILYEKGIFSNHKLVFYQKFLHPGFKY